MNTHNKYELPPLPMWMNRYTIPNDDFNHSQDDVILADRMLQYARAAIEADRQRRGEPVDIRQEVIETLEMILAVDWRKWEELASPDEFVRWAKSRANYALSIINEAPQPAEPDRGEPVPKGWKLVPETPTSKQIVHMALQIKGADADGTFRTDGDDWPEHVDAAERAYKWALSEAPQPAEPVTCFKCGHPTHRGECVNVAPQPAEPVLDKYQPCGCVICTCEDDVQCQGCGARHCGRHPIGELSDPVYVSAEPVNPRASSLAEIWRINADEAEAYGRQDVADTLRGCADEVETFDAPQPAEPVKVPSDTEIDDLWDLHEDSRTFARALLARYGQPATDSAGYTLGPISDGGMDPRNANDRQARITPADLDLAAEIWAAAQKAPGEGIEDAENRIAQILAGSRQARGEPIGECHPNVLVYGAGNRAVIYPVGYYQEGLGVRLYTVPQPQQIPEGYKLVPIEPTSSMIAAARLHHEGEAYLPVSLYKAMLEAAPEVKP